MTGAEQGHYDGASCGINHDPGLAAVVLNVGATFNSVNIKTFGAVDPETGGLQDLNSLFGTEFSQFPLRDVIRLLPANGWISLGLGQVGDFGPWLMVVADGLHDWGINAAKIHEDAGPGKYQ